MSVVFEHVRYRYLVNAIRNRELALEQVDHDLDSDRRTRQQQRMAAGEALELQAVIGFKGTVPGGLVLHPDNEHLIFPLGCTVVVRSFNLGWSPPESENNNK